MQIDPTQASVSAIARGVYDIYLRTYADSVRDYGHAVVIGFGHEMNTSRYSWGYGHVRPQVFVAAWRHIVTLFHSEGADNVTWLWTINQEGPGTGNISDWWPGSSYVTWVGIDGYYYRPSDTFATVFGNTITRVRIFSDKPILLSETAVGPPLASRSPRSTTCSTGCAGTRRSGWCGSTSPRAAASSARTGASRTARGQGGLPARRLDADAGAALTVAAGPGTAAAWQGPRALTEPTGPAGRTRGSGRPSRRRGQPSQHLDVGSLGPAARVEDEAGVTRDAVQVIGGVILQQDHQVRARPRRPGSPPAGPAPR